MESDISFINPDLQRYVVCNILPQYAHFDVAHRMDHAQKVIADSLQMASRFDVQPNMVYTIAAYHDIGLSEGREHHHLVSGRLLREDMALRQWFSSEQIEIMAQAVEDHRASSKHSPRSIYGRIVAEADRNICLSTIIRRTVQYGMSHYSQLNREEHIERALAHLEEKYSRRGYLRLWIKGSRNEKALHEVWDALDDADRLRIRIEKEIDAFEVENK